MGTRSKDRIKAMIAKDIADIYNRCGEVKRSINESLEDTLDYLNALIAQIPQSASGPLITKTPKVMKKKGMQHIETIPENEVIDVTISDSVMHIKTEEEEVKVEQSGRVKREASKKAAHNIKKQQSLTLNTKLRRQTDDDLHGSTIEKKKRESRTKRKKSARSSSDEDINRGPPKHSKVDENVTRESTAKNGMHVETQNQTFVKTSMTQQENNNCTMTLRHSNKKRSSTRIQDLSNVGANIIDDTLIAPMGNEVEEPSMYEDAIGKPTPIMNSTMNLNSTLLMKKLMNATVILEPLPATKLNETVTITKTSAVKKERNSKRKSESTDSGTFKSPQDSKITAQSEKALQVRMQQLKKAMANKEFDDLITDDDSSPDTKKPRHNIKNQEARKRQRRAPQVSCSSEDEVLDTPVRTATRGLNMGVQEAKNGFKSNALFSPYAKESVKKRVEAFEQAGMNSPNPTVTIDVPTRVTRTKTRAIASAQIEAANNVKAMDKTVTQKLARKSLAKAKKISLAKQIKDVDEYKENKLHIPQKVNKLASEKMNQKGQLKTTPLGKTKTQLPMSVNRIPHTPLNNQIQSNYTKALSAARTNIVTSVDSFIQPTKTASKPNSTEKMEEKKRKLYDEDARRKREEALRLQTEEKRKKRQEKELKNKLAREAKEKQDMEKRQKAEKEREEKARLAQQMQEKQREEMERKRLVQLQRAQEKEERRKQEELQRLQRLQEQEDAERLLAEQKRREQEAERRREADARAQQQAAAEAMRIKHQMAKYANHKNHGPTTYILDSEPEDDESDDESKPKHLIPHWAQTHIRKVQLAMQRYISDEVVFKFFDTRKCTPDLSELFHGIDRSKLKRTSSAIWKTPPRYSMMED